MSHGWFTCECGNHYHETQHPSGDCPMCFKEEKDMSLRDYTHKPEYPILEKGDVAYISNTGHGLTENNKGLYCVIEEYSPTGYYGMTGYRVSKYEHDLPAHDYEKDWVGVKTFGESPLVLFNTKDVHVVDEEHTSVAEGSKQEVDKALGITRDMGKHYRYSFRLNLSEKDIENGYVTVNIDPYRISEVYNLGGWREHIFKKVIRGLDKGHTIDELIEELQCTLNRAKQMREESREQ